MRRSLAPALVRSLELGHRPEYTGRYRCLRVLITCSPRWDPRRALGPPTMPTHAGSWHETLGEESDRSSGSRRVRLRRRATRCLSTRSERARNGRRPGTSSRSSRPSRQSQQEDQGEAAGAALGPGEKEYVFDTEDGRRRSPSSSTAAPSSSPTTSCSAPTTPRRVSRVHDPRRRPRRLARPPQPSRRDADVLLARADRAASAYKERMGWEFPYVSTYNTEFPFDFGLALTEEQAQQVPEIQEMVDDPPDWLVEWSHQIGAELKDGLRESPRLDRLRARERDRLPHLHRERARSVRRAVLQFPAQAHAQAPARGAPRLRKDEPGSEPLAPRRRGDMIKLATENTPMGERGARASWARGARRHPRWSGSGWA